MKKKLIFNVYTQKGLLSEKGVATKLAGMVVALAGIAAIFCLLF